MIPLKYKKTFDWDYVKDFILALFCILIMVGIFCSPYLVYRIDVWRSPCSKVYNEGILIYEGNSFFYKTESRGTSTLYQEYEKRFLFPKMKKEIMSNTLIIKTCEE